MRRRELGANDGPLADISGRNGQGDRYLAGRCLALQARCRNTGRVYAVGGKEARVAGSTPQMAGSTVRISAHRSRH